jgi:stage V sporulation protein B
LIGERTDKKGRQASSFLGGAFILSLGNFLSKVIGAITRIPLTGLLGAEGVGLYQLAYPFYCLLLTLSSSGLPSAISRMTAREMRAGGDGRGTMQSALKLFFIVGMGGTFAMFLLRGILSRWQGQGDDLSGGYLALCPAVVCVSLLSVLRGYFQGKCNMVPTAVSEVIEQAVKGAASIVAAHLFQADRVKAVTAVLFCVSLSEVVALIYLWAVYRKERVVKPLYPHPCPSFKGILRLTLPVAAAAAILPLSQCIDSRLCIRLLKDTGEAVALYGLYAGGAVTLSGLPVSICYGLAASIIPRLQGEGDGQKTKKALLVTIVLSLPCAVVLYAFSKPLGGLFFRNLSEERLEILSRLVRLLAPTALTHACAQTLAACLIGKGLAKKAARNMAVAVGVKLVLALLLVGRENISIYGMAIAANGCYFTAFVLNLCSNKYQKNGKK